MIGKITNKLRDASLTAAVFLMSSPVFAADKATTGGGKGLEGLASNGKAAVDAFNKLALGSFYLAGVVVFGMGCYLIYKEQGESGRGHGKKGVVGILVGGALLAMPSMINITTNTLSNSDVDSASSCVGSACSY